MARSAEEEQPMSADQMMKAGGMDSDAVLAEVGREARSRLSRVAESLGG
jgi:hypothetical protein